MPLVLLLSLLACSQDPSPTAATATAVEPAAAPAAAPAATVADSVHAASPYARAMPAGSPTSAAFLQLHNRGATDTALVAARSPVAATVELHTHTSVDGLMQMRQVPRIDLPAGETVVLEPGGLHIMLIGLEQELTVGSEIGLVLVYEDGSEAGLQVPVREIMPMMGAGSPGGMEPDQHHGSTQAPGTDG